jgi:hypothetical protein
VQFGAACLKQQRYDDGIFKNLKVTGQKYQS